MTLSEFFVSSYGWADRNASLILLLALVIPAAGTALAWIGKGGRTDTDGRFVASAVMGLAFAGVLLELSAILIAVGLLGTSVLGANVLLLLAPVLCLAGSVLGIRLVFPLSELGSVRTAMDLGLFLLACGGFLWLLSKFRGWSVFFLGSFLQLVVIGLLALFLLWRLFRRAFGPSRSTPEVDAAARVPAALPTVAPPSSTLVAGSMAVGVVLVSAGLLVGGWQYQQGKAPAPATNPAVVDAPPRPTGPSSPTPMPPPGRAPTAYTWVDADGSEHFVQRLEDVPETFRRGARPVE